MKRSSIIAVTLVLGFLSMVRSGAAAQGRERQDRSTGRVCFYQDANYRGWEECYNVGDEVTGLQSGHNSQASSIRIFGRARVLVYAEDGFRGASTEFSADVPDLHLRAAPEGHTWNDRIRSVRVVDERGGGVVGIPATPVPPPVVQAPRAAGIRQGICVYERANYQGREECFRPGDEMADFNRRTGLGDRISSVRVFGGARATFYRSANFRGESLVVERDIPDLARVRVQGGLRTWNDQISSVQVEDERGRGRGRGRGREDR